MIKWFKAQLEKKTKLNLVFDLLVIFFFSLLMFSIPACSFIPRLKIITWVLASLYVLFSVASTLFYKRIKVDLISVCFILFCVSAFISVIINWSFNSFVFTPFALIIFTCLTYMYCIVNKDMIKFFLIGSLIGIFGFIIIFIIKYFSSIIHLSFVRLGNDFGDENDIAIFFAFELLLLNIAILKTKKIYLKLILLIPSLIVIACGVTTGSKIFVLLTLVVVIFTIFLLFGKRRWWISVICLAAIAGLIVLFTYLPFFSVISDRMEMFIDFIFENNKNTQFDGSTYTRLQMFLDGMTMFLRKPLFGFGVQGFFRSSSFGFGWSHNNISESLCNFGIIGTLFFHFGLCYSLYAFSKKKCKNIDDYAMFLIILFFFVTMLSVALNSQKIYAFVIGLPIAYFSEIKSFAEVRVVDKKLKISFNLTTKNEQILNSRITIIGNNQNGRELSDGGCIKIRLYKKLLNENGYEVNLIDLSGWKFRMLTILGQINKAVKNGDKIIVMAGPNGCRYILPFVVKLSKKKSNEIVFCPVGVGTIDKFVRKMNPEKTNEFIKECKFEDLKDEKMGKYLKSLSAVVVENNILKRCYEQFYSLTNLFVVENFRVVGNIEIPDHKIYENDKPLNCVFFSRVHETKGILDLIKAVKKVNSSNSLIKLDIYGAMQLENQDEFYSLLDSNINYKGVVNSNESYKILSSYDLYCLPTKYYGEGTPGSLVESLVCGTPVLVSSYSQVDELIRDKENGFIFEINNLDSLIEALRDISLNKSVLQSISVNAKESSSKFIFKNIKNDFLRIFGGVEK